MIRYFQVFIFYGRPALYEKAVRVIITARNAPEFTFRHQTAGNCTRSPNDILGGIAPEMIGVIIQVD